MIPVGSWNPDLYLTKFRVFAVLPSDRVFSWVFVALFLPFALAVQTIGMGWPQYDVNKETCTCSCFDSRFKGGLHAHFPPSYKHWYFNMTFQSFLLWLWLVIGIAFCQQAVERIIRCVTAQTLNIIPLLLFLIALYSNFYGFWCVFNYVNDEFYPMMRSQAFFWATEMIVAATLLIHVEAARKTSDFHVDVCCSICCVHLLLAGFEGVVRGAFMRDLGLRNFRDIFLTSSDLLSSIYFILRYSDGLASHSLLKRARRVLVCIVLLLFFYMSCCSFS